MSTPISGTHFGLTAGDYHATIASVGATLRTLQFDGRDLVVDYTNDQWGMMRTRWHFEVLDHRVAHFDTGQA